MQTFIVHFREVFFMFLFTFTFMHFLTVCKLINPLTTDNECTCHGILAACYQLVKSVLKIGFCASKQDEMERWANMIAIRHPHGSCLGCIVEKAWQALAGQFFSFF